MTEDQILFLAIKANLFKKMGGECFQLFMSIEKLTKFTELILASQTQPTSQDTERLNWVQSNWYSMLTRGAIDNAMKEGKQ